MVVRIVKINLLLTDAICIFAVGAKNRSTNFEEFAQHSLRCVQWTEFQAAKYERIVHTVQVGYY
jgi:hypothetical protein